MKIKPKTLAINIACISIITLACAEEAPPTPTPTPTPPQESATPGPLDFTFRYMNAMQLLRAAQYEEAIAEFNFLIRVLPDLALAYHGRGLAYHHENQQDLALHDINKAIALDPDFADAYRNRGIILVNMGNVNGLEDLERARLLYEASVNTKGIQDVEEFLERTQ